jgi:hypothetical protein
MYVTHARHEFLGAGLQDVLLAELLLKLFKIFESTCMTAKEASRQSKL